MTSLNFFIQILHSLTIDHLTILSCLVLSSCSSHYCSLLTMCDCMHVCMHVCMYVWLYSCMYACVIFSSFVILLLSLFILCMCLYCIFSILILLWSCCLFFFVSALIMTLLAVYVDSHKLLYVHTDLLFVETDCSLNASMQPSLFPLFMGDMIICCSCFHR